MAYINGKKVLFSANVNMGDIVPASGTIDISTNGIHDVTQYASANVNVENTGDYGSGKYICRVIDYDGTILKEKHLNTGEVFTMPDIPTHDRLVFQEWATPVDIVNNQVTVGNSDLIFGAVYTTASGLTEFDIELTKATGLEVTLNMSGTKNWGDGTTNTATTHTYTNYGEYMITCDGSGLYAAGSEIFYQGSSEDTMNYFCKRVRLSSNVSAIKCSLSGEGWFDYCISLESVTIPTSVVEIGERAFMNCYSLKCLILPNNAVVNGASQFKTCHSLENIVLTKTSCSVCIPDISSNFKLMYITIPEGATMPSGAKFGNCGFKRLTIPKSISNIPSGGFQSLRLVLKYDFTNHTTVPTLASTSAFDYINRLAKIIVPDNLYDTWIAATNWSSFSSYIYKASEVTE